MNGLTIYGQHPKYIACIDNSSFQHTHFKANPVYAQEYPNSLTGNIFDKSSAKTLSTFESQSSGKIYFRALTNFTSTFPYYGIQPGQCIWNLPPGTIFVTRYDGYGVALDNAVTIISGLISGSTSWDDWGPIFGGIQNEDIFTPYYPELFAVSQGELYARVFKYEDDGIFTPYYASTPVSASQFPYFCYRDANGVPTQQPIPNGTYYLTNNTRNGGTYYNFYSKNYSLNSISNTEQAIRYENIDGDRYTNVILYKVLRSNWK